MISDRHQCIFIHIPKNGGASIERLIWRDEEFTEENLWLGFKSGDRNAYQTGGLQHLFAQNVKKAVGAEKYERYFKFSMVRNPWDKAISQYLYLQKRGDLRRFLGLPRHASFKKYLSTIPKKPHVHWLPQVEFILDKNGDLMVDLITRFESYSLAVDSILNEVKTRTSHPLPQLDDVPHLNKSKRQSYLHYYDEESIGMVEELYQKDISYFDYTFDWDAYRNREIQLPFPVPQNWISGKWKDLQQRWK